MNMYSLKINFYFININLSSILLGSMYDVLVVIYNGQSYLILNSGRLHINGPAHHIIIIILIYF